MAKHLYQNSTGTTYCCAPSQAGEDLQVLGSSLLPKVNVLWVKLSHKRAGRQEVFVDELGIVCGVHEGLREFGVEEAQCLFK